MNGWKWLEPKNPPIEPNKIHLKSATPIFGGSNVNVAGCKGLFGHLDVGVVLGGMKDYT